MSSLSLEVFKRRLDNPSVKLLHIRWERKVKNSEVLSNTNIRRF